MLIYFFNLLIMCISINYTLLFEQPVSNYSDLSLTVSKSEWFTKRTDSFVQESDSTDCVYVFDSLKRTSW